MTRRSRRGRQRNVLSSLTQGDVHRLIADGSAATRAETAMKVAREYEGGEFTDRERLIAEAIFRTMVRDAEVRVRKALAEELKASATVPHDVALSLAMDVDEVALPVLEYSEVLSERDLIEIIGTSGVAKQIAIAGRKAVSDSVAEALVETDREEVVGALVANDDARLGEETLGRIVDRFGDSGEIQAKLVDRRLLPATIAERLVLIVSERLRDKLAKRHNVPREVTEGMILKTRERAVIGLAADSDDTGLERLARHLHQEGRLTPSIILRALCTGDIRFFEASLAARAGVPLTNARVLIHDQGPLGLAAIHEEAGLPSALLPAVRRVVAVAKETEFDGGANDRERHSRRMIERVLTQFEELGAENLEYLLDRLGQLGGPAPSP